jgi:GNAT superfamily N-acetyltransferase
MKPLLILAPSPSRWQAFEQLLGHEERLWLDDLRLRLTEGVRGSRDAFAALPDGSRLLASACVRRRHDVAVLGHVFTIPAQRQRGHARALLQAVLSWFDMSGGKWLYGTCSRELAENVFGKFGFGVLHRSGQRDDDRVTVLRTPAHAGESPFERLGGEVEVRDATRADWPLIVALLQHYCGPDPRVALEESALAAEATALDLFTQQQQGVCHLMVACRQKRVIGLGSVATAETAERTYAMTLPHDQPVDGLRQALIDFGRARGCAQVDFPMEALARSAAAEQSPAGSGEATS